MTHTDHHTDTGTGPRTPDALDLCEGDPGDGWGCVLPDGHDGVHKSDEDDADDETLAHIVGNGPGQCAQRIRYVATKLAEARATAYAGAAGLPAAADRIVFAIDRLRSAIHLLEADDA